MAHKPIDFFNNWQLSDWEMPRCSYCGSNFLHHKQIYYNVKDTAHSLVECQVCQLRFYSPRIRFSSLVRKGFGTYEDSRIEAEHFYEHGSFFDVKDKGKQKREVESYYKGFINKIIKANKIPTSVFEIGGGIGWFSSVLKKECNVKIIDGCEINKWAVKIANEKFGLNYSVGEFDKYIPHKTYDCGIMIDFIEHSYTPFQDLKKLAGMIESGGTLFIKTFLEEFDTKRTMESPPYHSYHFYGNVLKKIIEEVGFNIIHWEKENSLIIIIGKKK